VRDDVEGSLWGALAIVRDCRQTLEASLKARGSAWMTATGRTVSSMENDVAQFIKDCGFIAWHVMRTIRIREQQSSKSQLQKIKGDKQ
jgi:hypothetical protein